MDLKKIIFLALAIAVFVSCSDDEEDSLNNLRVEAQEDSFLLKWDGGNGNDMVYRSTGTDEPVFYADPESWGRFENYDLELGLTYNYQMVRHDENGAPTGMKTSVVSVDCEGFEPNIANVEISKSPSNPYHASISWNAYFIRDISSGYYIKINKKEETDLNFSYLATVDNIVGEGTYIDEWALSPGERVDYEVVLYDEADNIISSEDNFIRVDHNFDLIPTNVSVSIISTSNQTFHISWDPAGDAEEYSIDFRVNNEGWSDDYYTGTNTEGDFEIYGTLEDGDVIQFRVAGHKDDYTEYSDVAEITW
ncbi:fibronectin type III domain-containing protein [Salinivirga cyanobacteriivorans]